MGFYALYNETSHEEILPDLGSAGTEKKGTKKYAAPAKLLSYLLNLLFFFFVVFTVAKAAPTHALSYIDING